MKIYLQELMRWKEIIRRKEIYLYLWIQASLDHINSLPDILKSMLRRTNLDQTLIGNGVVSRDAISKSNIASSELTPGRDRLNPDVGKIIVDYLGPNSITKPKTSSGLTGETETKDSSR